MVYSSLLSLSPTLSACYWLAGTREASPRAESCDFRLSRCRRPPAFSSSLASAPDCLQTLALSRAPKDAITSPASHRTQDCWRHDTARQRHTARLGKGLREPARQPASSEIAGLIWPVTPYHWSVVIQRWVEVGTASKTSAHPPAFPALPPADRRLPAVTSSCELLLSLLLPAWPVAVNRNGKQWHDGEGTVDRGDRSGLEIANERCHSEGYTVRGTAISIPLVTSPQFTYRLGSSVTGQR